MKRINAKKPKETTRDRHLKWINYYSSKNFGIWVECTDCKKWRRTFQYSESHEVPDHWCCSQLTLDSGEKGSCNDPEEDSDEQYLEYCPGSVVWAKLEGYPWWPGMVDEEPDIEEFSWREKGTLHYNVTFLDEKPTRAWIPEMFICPFLKFPKEKKGPIQRLRQNRYAKAISKAKERAEEAMKMAIKDRLQTYSFVHLYKGHWPAAPNFDERDDEETESTNVEALADSLMKELDELGSLYSTDSDDEIIEDFNVQENNKVEKGKQVPKNSDISSFKKKAYNAKYLNNKDFISESEAVFPLIKKKNSKDSSLANKTTSNVNDQILALHTKSNASPPQTKEAKGIKRKTNRKFVPKKQKNFEKSTRNSTMDIIDLENTDSEHENGEQLISVPKINDGKNIHDSEEKSLVEDSENSSHEMPNCEKHKTDDNSNNVEPLYEKEFDEKINVASKKNNPSSDLSIKENFQHIDESISKVLEFTQNETLDEFEEFKKSEPLKINKISNEKQKKIVKQKKLQNSLENRKQSNNNVENLEKGITHSSQVPPETKMLQNVSNSSLSINKQKIKETIKYVKKSQKIIKPTDSKVNKLPKQPNSSFSLPLKNSAENHEAVFNKEPKEVNMKKDKKVMKPTNQNSDKDSSLKVKPNFKLPIKAGKHALEKVKNVKTLSENRKLKAVDIKQKMSVESEENRQENLADGVQNRNDSIKEKPMENLLSEKCKEEKSAVISTDTMKATENDDENFFYVSVSDEEMDCETLSG